MFFHVYIFEPYEEGGHAGRSFYFRNLDEEALRTRIVDAWDRGTPMTWDGETAKSVQGQEHQSLRLGFRLDGSTT